MKFLELFAGIGGFRAGLESLGHECVGWVEIDKHARQSYEAIWPNAKKEWTAHDITEVRSDDIPRCDLWGFGFPCQDLSIAGRRLGFNGNRSSLFFTVMELLRGIPERDRPEWLIAENTMGFFSSNNGWDFLAAQVAMAEVGYDTEYDVFNAAEFGIPQNRERVFLIGHLRIRGRRKIFPIRQADKKVDSDNKELNRDFKIIQRGRGYNDGGLHDIAPTVSSHSYQENNMVVSAVNDCIRDKKTQNGRRVKEPDEPMFTLTAQDRHGVMVVRNNGEWSERETAQCLDANYYKGIDNHGARTAIATNARIRKLTPKECWRLQGRHDWEFERARQAGVSDSQLYRQAGNSLVPIIVTNIAKQFEVNESDDNEG